MDSDRGERTILIEMGNLGRLRIVTPLEEHRLSSSSYGVINPTGVAVDTQFADESPVVHSLELKLSFAR